MNECNTDAWTPFSVIPFALSLVNNKVGAVAHEKNGGKYSFSDVPELEWALQRDSNSQSSFPHANGNLPWTNHMFEFS